MPTGRVVELHRWPVKSMAGEPVGAMRVDGRGAGGDRTHVVRDVFRGRLRVLTAREAPRLLAWHAAYPQAPGDALAPADPPLAVVSDPAGRSWRWDEPGLPEALSADLGRDVSLHRDPRGVQDLGETVLVTFEATRRAIEAELARPLDLRRFRTNVHVDADAPPFAEEGWEGRRLRVGDAELELLHPCERCVIPTRDPDTREKWPDLLRWLTAEHGGRFGINARPLGPARLAVGDAVEVA